MMLAWALKVEIKMEGGSRFVDVDILKIEIA